MLHFHQSCTRWFILQFAHIKQDKQFLNKNYFYPEVLRALFSSKITLISCRNVILVNLHHSLLPPLATNWDTQPHTRLTGSQHVKLGKCQLSVWGNKYGDKLTHPHSSRTTKSHYWGESLEVSAQNYTLSSLTVFQFWGLFFGHNKNFISVLTSEKRGPGGLVGD